MKIVIINGSPRISGSTAKILNVIKDRFATYSNTDVELFNLSELTYSQCNGCCVCFKNGSCYMNDDLENLSSKIETADILVLGTPTYACNVSGLLKVFIDRGHFILEQLLRDKYCLGVVTYENYGGSVVKKYINNLFSYSGADLYNTMIFKNEFSNTSIIKMNEVKMINKRVDKLYFRAVKKNKSFLQHIKSNIIFHYGIKLFVLKKGSEYIGVVKKWGRT